MSTTEEIKQQLNSAWYCQKRLDADLDKIAQLRATAERITPVYSLAPGGGVAVVCRRA